jgi:hypothetical protein
MVISFTLPSQFVRTRHDSQALLRGRTGTDLENGRGMPRRALIATILLLSLTTPALAADPLADAHRLFYSGRYEEAAALALGVRTEQPGNLAAWELRSAALLFQLKRVFGEPKDRDRAWKDCAACQPLLDDFLAEFNAGRLEARAAVERDPLDADARFFLGKLNLNYVWLQLGTLGRRTGWGEYWEARRSVDAVLKENPEHVRARVARAWIDYIVDTRVPWAMRWALGGANKERGMLSLQDAARAEGDFFAQTEAAFALWEMHVREENFTDAVILARTLARDFPENRELARFLTRHDTTATP